MFGLYFKFQLDEKTCLRAVFHEHGPKIGKDAKSHLKTLQTQLVKKASRYSFSFCQSFVIRHEYKSTEGKVLEVVYVAGQMADRQTYQDTLTWKRELGFPSTDVESMYLILGEFSTDAEAIRCCRLYNAKQETTRQLRASSVVLLRPLPKLHVK